jgi:hypothetical protein
MPDDRLKGPEMIENSETTVAEIGRRLLDDAYIAWFSAEAECGAALDAWLRTAGAGRTMKYLTYRAALDREEAAARDLERLWAVSEPCREALVGHADTLFD